MMVKTLADLNQLHKKIWEERNKQFRELIDLPEIQAFIKKRFVQAQPQQFKSAAQALDRLRRKKCLYTQVLAYRYTRYQQRSRAQQPRRKAARIGLSRRELVAAFASRPENRARRTKALWKPFFSYLQDQGLNVIRNAHPIDTYEYDGERDRLYIRYRQFEKIVSELAPRRRARR
jgi:hypothetical protein